MRDALNVLANEKILNKKERVGYFVKKFSEIEIREILEMRKISILHTFNNYFDRINKDKIKEIKTISETKENFLLYSRLLENEIVFSSKNNYLIKEYKRIDNYYRLILASKSLNNQKKNKQYFNDIIKYLLENNKERSYEILLMYLESKQII